MKTIVYVHGFGGSGEGSKAKIFRNYFKDKKFLAPSLSYIPELAIKTLEEIVDCCGRDVYLIGSSLGGYYSLYLSKNAKVKKVVLINPAVEPVNTLQQFLGNATNFYDNSIFSWQEKHLDMLKQYSNSSPDLNKILLLTQKGDELLDYTQAVKLLQGCEQVIEENGNHGFEGIERHLDRINSFLVN